MEFFKLIVAVVVVVVLLNYYSLNKCKGATDGDHIVDIMIMIMMVFADCRNAQPPRSALVRGTKDEDED